MLLVNNMSIFEAIINHYNSQLDLISQHTEQLTPYIAEAAYLLNQTFLEDGKILSACAKDYYPVSQHFAQLLDGQLHQRPALPHICLTQQSNALLDVDPQRAQQFYSRQITALAKAEDTLVLFASSGLETQLLHAIHAANQVGMNLILINSGDHQLSQAIECNNVVIQLQAPIDPLQAQSLQFLTASLLANLLEQLLFGSFE